MTATLDVPNIRPFPPDVLLGITTGSDLHVHRARSTMATLAERFPELADRYAQQLVRDVVWFIAGGGATDPVRLARDVRGICQASGVGWAL